jgi:hypothetical protein
LSKRYFRCRLLLLKSTVVEISACVV